MDQTQGQERIPTSKVIDFCRKWKVSELALFGSALRDDFRPDSDFDLLISFFPNAHWSLLDHVQMQLELQQELGRAVDLVSKSAILRSENWIRREEILGTAQVIYSESNYAYSA